jgi:hypothetical protein
VVARAAHEAHHRRKLLRVVLSGHLID